MKYRREIDGIRAVAILPVILFHAEFTLFKGGFVGVDVFFVVSGYLITTMVLGELENGTFSILKFYERRARRILPGLYFVSLFSIPFAWHLMSPPELMNYGKSLIAVSLFVSNLFFWRSGGYFETTNGLLPLLHTWSLAVEEQFYLFFPILLILVWRIGRKYLVRVLAPIFIISVFLTQLSLNTNPTAAFYLLPTRVWELLIGAFSAIYLTKSKKMEVPRFFGEILSITGLLMIIYSVFTFSNAIPYPSFYTFIPTLGTLLIIIFATFETSIGRFLGNKLFVGIGLLSYSAYLWHQPVFVFSRYWKLNESLTLKLGLIVVVFILSLVSWHFVEKPFRSKNRISPRLVAILSISIGSFLIVIGAITSKLETNFEKTMAEELSTSQAIFVTNVNERIFIKNRIDVENVIPDTLIIGSSRIMQIGNHNNEGINLNLSVSGASVEDILAISYLATNKYRPAKIYISADPWLFNLNSGQGRWSALSAAYEAEIKNLGINRKLSDTPDESPLPFNRLFAKVYTRVTVNQIVAADDRPALIDKIRKDGSRVYNIQYANESSATVEREASGAPGYAMKNYEYSESARDQLESLLKKLRVKSSIFLILSPYHPTAFEIMQRENLPHLQIEQMYRDIANRTGVQIVGSYDPAVVGCSKFEFFDGMHPKGSCMKKVLLGSQSK